MAEENEGESWWDRNAGAVETAAAGAAALLFHKPIGRAAARLGETALAAPVKQMGQGLRGTFAPTSRGEGASDVSKVKFTTPEATSAREAEALIRQHMGRAARATDVGVEQLAPHWSRVGQLPLNEKQDLVHYMETRSAGGRLANPELQPAADTMRAAYKRIEQGMLARNTKGHRTSFVEDYYRHAYKPIQGAAQDANFLTKFGSGSFTRARSIPTIAEARLHGYEPITEDPIEMTMRYLQNAEHFLAREDILDQAKTQGFTRTTNKAVPVMGKDIPMGWQPIMKKGLQTVYAPEGFARVFNNFKSVGMTGAMGDVYRPLQHSFNMATAAELGLSGFHATTIANEGVVSEVARAIQQAYHGDPAAAIGTALKAPLAPFKLYKTGKEVEKSWLGTSPGTAHMQRIVNLMERGGGRIKPKLTSEEYRYSSAGSFFEAWQRGARGLDLIADRQAFTEGFTPAVKAFGKNLGRVFESMAYPIFDKYVPRMKNGAFYETMSTWLQHNPAATMKEQEHAARIILDSIDNRFGEMIHDNIFWDKTLKQSASLMMRSYSWNKGTIGEIGGGVMDIAKGDLNSPRAAYVVALPVVFGAVNAVYQGLKTGQAPQDMQDLIAPRTGGTDPATGLPERLSPVGYMKDVFGWYEDPVQEAKNKIATGPRLAGEMLTGRDWKNDPIAPPDAGAPEHIKAYAKHVTEAFLPISVKNQWERKKGSEIGRAEAFMGLRPAGRQYVDPEGLKAIKERQTQKEWQRKTKREAKQESYYEGSD
jgi:hypothetical protein